MSWTPQEAAGAIGQGPAGPEASMNRILTACPTTTRPVPMASVLSFLIRDHFGRVANIPNGTPVRRFSREQRRALEMLASAPRGISEQSLVVAHGFAAELLAELVLAGLATAVTETVRAGGPQGRAHADHRRRTEGAPRFIKRKTIGP